MHILLVNQEFQNQRDRQISRTILGTSWKEAYKFKTPVKKCIVNVKYIANVFKIRKHMCFEHIKLIKKRIRNKF